MASWKIFILGSFWPLSNAQKLVFSQLSWHIFFQPSTSQGHCESFYLLLGWQTYWRQLTNPKIKIKQCSDVRRCDAISKNDRFCYLTKEKKKKKDGYQNKGTNWSIIIYWNIFSTMSNTVSNIHRYEWWGFYLFFLNNSLHQYRIFCLNKMSYKFRNV